MSAYYIKLYLTSVQPTFSGVDVNYEDAKYVLMGVPFDSTSSYRPGSRFAPKTIREISIEMESFDAELSLDFDHTPFHDAGDIKSISSPEDLIKKVSMVVKDTIKDGKIPIIIGGEHTTTLGSVVGLKELSDFNLIFLDAHLDLRDEYPVGARVTHATVLRRCAEKIGCDRIIVIGARAVSKEEVEYADRCKIKVFYYHELIYNNLDKLIDSIGGNAYISIDMDVLDPGLAPGVSNPEPPGISFKELIDILKTIMRNIKLVGMDVTEVNPLYDPSGVTSAYAAAIIKKIVLLNEAKQP
ncbi:MAG: agmatinase [Thermoprotei archaeon]|nr:MAG: agmatinase [Thermoprotei archaeon]